MRAPVTRPISPYGSERYPGRSAVSPHDVILRTWFGMTRRAHEVIFVDAPRDGTTGAESGGAAFNTLFYSVQ